MRHRVGGQCNCFDIALPDTESWLYWTPVPLARVANFTHYTTVKSYKSWSSGHMLQGWFKDVTRLLQGCCKGSMTPHLNYQNWPSKVTVKFIWWQPPNSIPTKGGFYPTTIWWITTKNYYLFLGLTKIKIEPNLNPIYIIRIENLKLF